MRYIRWMYQCGIIDYWTKRDSLKYFILFVLLILFATSFQGVSFAEIETQTSLEKLLPSEEKLEIITNGNVWNYVHKNTEFDHDSGIKDSISALLRDITRIYEPIHYKFKVPTIMIEITEYEDKIKLNRHWNGTKNIPISDMVKQSYLIGSPNDSTECFFDYSSNGALTVCIFENILIQSTIFDKYNEHFTYDEKEIQLDKYEMSSSIMSEIIQNISDKKNIENEKDLYKVFQNKKLDNNTQNNKTIKVTDTENTDKFGVQNISCTQDEFGLISISGQYNNDEIQKEQVSLVVSFLDRNEENIGKSIADLYNIKKFENKRFMGNTLWDETFFTCIIKIK